MTQFKKLSGLALARFRKKQYAPALELWQWSLQESAKLRDKCVVRNNIAVCHFLLGRHGDAIALSQVVLDAVAASFGADDDLCRKARKRIASSRRALSDARATRMYSEASAKYNAKEYNQAYKLWLDSEKYKCEPSRSWQAIRLMCMAMCCYRTGRYVNAAALITRANEFADSGALIDEADAELFQLNLQRIRVSFECQEAHKLLDEVQTRLNSEDWDRAESYAREALCVVDQCSVGRECWLGARVLDRLATACYKQGYSRCAEAAGYWTEARWLAERWAGKEQPELAARCREMLERCRSN